MNITQKLIVSGLLFVITVVLGIILSKLGKPYNNVLFNIHKLIAFFAVIIFALNIFNLLKTSDIKIIIIIFIVIVVLSIIALFVTGALLSVGKLPYALLNTIHIAATILAITGLSAIVYYFLSVNK